MPVKRRVELLNWAYAGEGRYIIEDDYDSEFRFTGKPLPTMESIDTRGRVIYMNTFSKTISPSLRISYMVLPFELFYRYKALLGFYSCTVSGIEQYALAKFIEGGYFESHINRMRKTYKAKRDLIIKAIRESPLVGKAEILEENSGLHFIIKLNTDLSDEEIIGRAKARGLNISFLSQYAVRPENSKPSMAIINYSGIDTDAIKNAVEMLAEIISPSSV
jgi:GntR family transcriptional regulator/MocR family aminotransferase